MQIHESPKDNENLSKALKYLAMFTSLLIWWSLWSLLNQGVSDVPIYGLQFFGLAILGLATSLFIIPISWNIGNSIRKWIKPDVFIAYNATDGFEKKLFWLVGPQAMSTFIASLLFFGVSFYITSPLTSKKNSNDNSENIKIQVPMPSKPNEATPVTNSNNVVDSTTGAPEAAASRATSEAILNPNTSTSPQLAGKLSVDEAKALESPGLTKDQVFQMELKANYHGNDPIVRARLGLPEKPSSQY
jgi:hypothetical protein